MSFLWTYISDHFGERSVLTPQIILSWLSNMGNTSRQGKPIEEVRFWVGDVYVVNTNTAMPRLDLTHSLLCGPLFLPYDCVATSFVMEGTDRVSKKFWPRDMKYLGSSNYSAQTSGCRAQEIIWIYPSSF